MADEKRTGFLAKLLGKDNAESVQDTVAKAQADLDAAKVARKDATSTPPPPDSTTANGPSDATKAVVSALLQAFTDAGITDAVLATANGPKSPEDFASFLLQAVGAVVDKEEAAEPADTGAMPAAAKELGEVRILVKALEDSQSEISQYIASTVKDNGMIAGAVLDISGLLKDLTPTMAGLDSRLKAIEDRLGDTPRQASKALETVVEDETLKNTIREGLEGEATFLGVKVTKPVGSNNGHGSK